jgi:uncharacterized protein (DUF1330 family)
MEEAMPAYLLPTVKSVKDRIAMEEYWSRAGASFEGSGAKHLAVYTPFKLLEGKGPIEGVVAIEFPDMEAARRWYESAALSGGQAVPGGRSRYRANSCGRRRCL